MSHETDRDGAISPSNMSGRRKFRIGLVAAGALGLAVIGAGAVQAQRAGGFDGFGSSREGGPGGWRGERGGEGREARRMEHMRRFCANDRSRYEPAGRMFVKADLRLTKEQETAFDTLADTVLPALKDIKAQVCATATQPHGTAPERLQRRAAVLGKMAEAAQKAIEPTNKFYALLDDGQKARVEQLLQRHRGLRVLFGRGDGPMMDGPRGGDQGGRWGGWRQRRGQGDDGQGPGPGRPMQQ